MDDFLHRGITIALQKVEPCFESTWKQVVDTTTVPEYEIIIWGSVVQDKDRVPNDLDVIVRYTGDHISSEKTDSIESIIKDTVSVELFSYVDVLVQHREDTEEKISNSRVSSVYSATESEWVKFD